MQQSKLLPIVDGRTCASQGVSNTGRRAAGSVRVYRDVLQPEPEVLGVGLHQPGGIQAEVGAILAHRQRKRGKITAPRFDLSPLLLRYFAVDKTNVERSFVRYFDQVALRVSPPGLHRKSTNGQSNCINTVEFSLSFPNRR